MSLKDLIPWNRGGTMPAAFNDDRQPFFALHREMNRVFDNFFRGMEGFDAGRSWSMGWPSVEVRDTDSQVEVVAELPGLDEKDVEITLHNGMLTLKGEKKSESGNASYNERWHGQFQRSLSLGPDVDPDKVNASFKNGVLTVTLGKRPEAQRQVKRIPIAA
jgi:HSP20 family protein